MQHTLRTERSGRDLSNSPKIV